MKNFKVLIVALTLATGYMACKKPTVVSSNVSNADAASIISNSLAVNTYGVNSISNDISLSVPAPTVSGSNVGCAVTKIDTFTRRSAVGASAYYYYQLSYTQKLNCNTSNLPDNITGNLTYLGNFNSAALTLTNSGTTSYTLAGLTSTATVYTLNGEYKSAGTFKLKSDTTNTGSVNADIVVKNVTINKTTLAFTGGTATAIITGTTNKKGDFTYNGTLTFTGSSVATLALNGSNYSLNLLTGAIAPK